MSPSFGEDKDQDLSPQITQAPVMILSWGMLMQILFDQGRISSNKPNLLGIVLFYLPLMEATSTYHGSYPILSRSHASGKAFSSWLSMSANQVMVLLSSP